LDLADAFINGDISFVDKNEGLLNFFMVKWKTSLQLIKYSFACLVLRVDGWMMGSSRSHDI